MKLVDLPTPSLVLNETTMLENMDKVDEILKGKKARLRPHYKSHKCAAIAHLQVERGAVGMTCAKLGEAEDLIFSGIENVLIANEIVDPIKIARVAQLAKLCRLTVCVDNIENARALSDAAVKAGSTLHCYVEFDIGMSRCGVFDMQEYIETAKAVVALPNLEYDGIQAYAGHISHMLTKEERKTKVAANSAKLRELIKLLNESGIEVRDVSGGSTGTIDIKAEEGLYTELQAGSYFMMDNTYRELDLPYKNALFVLATVIHKRPGVAIADVGVKGLGTDQAEPAVFRADGTPVNCRIDVHEEHMMLRDPSIDLSIGDRLLIIPGHCCSTVNLYDNIYLFRGDKVVNRLAVTARGLSR